VLEAVRRILAGSYTWGLAMSGLHLVIDPIACDGHGLCTELFPEGVVLDDWGFPRVRTSIVPSAQLRHARRAVAACPKLALRLQPSTETPDRGRAPARR
jgi:ferredoxin